MRLIKLTIATILVSMLVAVTYFVFERSVSIATEVVWQQWFSTDQSRLMILPIIFGLGYVYFGAQHYLDGKHENRLTHSLEENPKPTLGSLFKILGLGFLSLVAGASLGPEAILVPACILIGSYTGKHIFKTTEATTKTLAQLAFIALFAAFFNSVYAGLLGLFLVLKRHKSKPSIIFILLAVVASAVTVAVQNKLDPSPFVEASTAGFEITLLGLFGLLILVFIGTLLTHGIDYTTRFSVRMHKKVAAKGWWASAFIACSGLSILYLIGGPLVQFTGNAEIQPMLEQAPQIGFFGIMLIIIIKLAAISWSKALGYRGGMIFPSVFVAAAVVALMQLYLTDIHFVYGLVAVLVGMYLTDKKLKILF